MAKKTATSITSGYATTTQLNAEFVDIADHLNNKVLYRDNPDGEANHMLDDLDMNSNNLLNVGNINGADANLLNTFQNKIDEAAASATLAEDWADASAASAAASAVSAANALISETNASQSAADAAVYSSMGLGGAAGFDFGSVTDEVVIFPTDFGFIV